MKVKQGRGGGHTTQMFIDILASDKDVIVRCKNPWFVSRMFIEMFQTLINEESQKEVVLVDGRKIKFVSMSDINSQVGFDGITKTDI